MPDSEGEKGRFYVWDIAELRDVGGPGCLRMVRRIRRGQLGGQEHPVAPRLRGIARPPEIEFAKARPVVSGARDDPGRAGRQGPQPSGNAMAIAALAMQDLRWRSPPGSLPPWRTPSARSRSYAAPSGRWLRSWRPGTRRRPSGSGRSGTSRTRPTTPGSSKPLPRLGEATGHAKWANAAPRNGRPP